MLHIPFITLHSLPDPQTPESSSEAEAADLNLPALTPEDSALGPATAPDTAKQAEMTTVGVSMAVRKNTHTHTHIFVFFF